MMYNTEVIDPVIIFRYDRIYTRRCILIHEESYCYAQIILDRS